MMVGKGTDRDPRSGDCGGDDSGGDPDGGGGHEQGDERGERRLRIKCFIKYIKIDNVTALH